MRGLWPGSSPQCPPKVSSQHTKCESNLFYLEHHLHRPCGNLLASSHVCIVGCPYQSKSETFRAQLPSKSRVTVCRASDSVSFSFDSEPFPLNFLYASHLLARLLSFTFLFLFAHLKLFQNFISSPYDFSLGSFSSRQMATYRIQRQNCRKLK